MEGLLDPARVLLQEQLPDADCEDQDGALGVDG